MPRRLTAFTLIETLLVLVVIAMIALTAIRFLAAQTDELKIQMTAKTLRQWLAAGQRYYQDSIQADSAGEGQWPPNSKTLIETYPGLLVSQNPWRAPYQVIALPDSATFAVATTLPTLELAKRLAHSLSQAEIIEHSTVIAYAGSPVKPQLNRQLIIKDIGKVDNHRLYDWHHAAGDQPGADSARLKESSHVNTAVLRANAGRLLIPVPTCPAGMSAQYQVYLSGFQKGCLQNKNLNPFSADFGNFFCADSILLSKTQTSFTRQVKPIQVRSQPIQTDLGRMWEVWVQTSGDTAVPGKLIDISRDLPNYRGSLTYITYCQGAEH